MGRKRLAVSFSPGEAPFDTPSWVDITDRVQAASWTWGRQRDDEAFPPGQATVVLQNHDREFDPDNTSSTYTGDLLPRVPFRFQYYETALDLPGSAGATASTPDHADFAVTDLDVRAHLAMDDWTPGGFGQFVVSQYASTNIAWAFGLSTGGNLTLIMSTDGSATVTRSSTVATGFTDGTDHWIRATLDADNGAAGHDVEFFTSDDGETWTQLGTTVTTAGTFTLFNSTASVAVGDVLPLAGQVRYAEIRSTIDGTVIANPEFADQDPGTTSFEDTTGKTWTVNGSAGIAYDTTVTHDLFYGFVEDGWEQTYRHPIDGYCTVQLVDLLAVIEGYTLPAVVTSEILADSPVAYWPLNETRGLRMRDASNNHGDGHYIHGTTELARTANDPGGGVARGFELDGDHWGYIQDLAATVHTRPACIELMFRPGADAGETTNAILYRSGTGNPNEGNTVEFALGAGDTWFMTSVVRDGAANNVARTSLFPRANDTVHHYMHRRPAASDAIAYVDGSIVTDTVFTAPANGIAVAPGSVVGAADYQSFGFGGAPQPWQGFLAHVAIYDTDIGHSRVVAHAAAAIEPLDGYRSDEQIGWALDEIGVPAGMRNSDTGRSILGPADTENRDALDFIRTVTRTEQGKFYVDHANSGTLRFVERYSPWLADRSTVSQATFSDDPTAENVARVEPGSLVVEANGVRSVVNQATVRWSGGDEIASDTTSIAAYGPRGQTIDTVSPTPNQALSLAQWAVLLQADPVTRIRGFGINPGAATGEFATAVRTQIGDLVTYRSQPSSTGTVVTRNLLVEGITHQVEGVEWVTTFYTSETPADLVDLFILDTSLLDGTDVLAY